MGNKHSKHIRLETEVNENKESEKDQLLALLNHRRSMGLGLLSGCRGSLAASRLAFKLCWLVTTTC